MIKNLRMFSQQLADPVFDRPEDLVSWMGAVQAQDCVMSKWAVGVRLKTPSLPQVEKALEAGKIVRTHILRPTWHMVAAEDVRWMLQLTQKRQKQAIFSWGKQFGVDETLNTKGKKQLEKILKDGRHLTKQEIGDELVRSGAITDIRLISCLLPLAETDGLICNGAEKNRKHTYALMDERVPPGKDYHKDEMLAILARKYFRSHSPASLPDFTWWSGLTATEAKHAIKLLGQELITEKLASENLYLHEYWSGEPHAGDVTHLLPPYDEYLISYKGRYHVLPEVHAAKAFNHFGIFYPVVLQNGMIIGNWKKTQKKKQTSVETTFFDKKTKVSKKLMKQAQERYRKFNEE